MKYPKRIIIKGSKQNPRTTIIPFKVFDNYWDKLSLIQKILYRLFPIYFFERFVKEYGAKQCMKQNQN